MGKTALITGGSRGIGAATAKYLAARGYGICINYHTNEQAAQTLVTQIKSEFQVPCIALRADVSDEAQVVRLFADMDEQLAPVTHLVNNVGVLFKQMTVSDMDAERINKTLATNVTSYFLCSREAIKRMQPGCAIVNVSSVASRTGSPGEYVDYAASKGAVDVFTRGLSLELAGKGIRVNCVRPGFIYTDIHADGGEPGRVDRVSGQIPMLRGGQPEEVASAIAWLLSDEASYVTGSFIDLAGGR
ncbi:oxidoreductase [Advenella kashmirensis W13003]|uniref:Oxidoreductase n=1 Tax=Advenella kashmirensis W13003 TaxID=1424334 RepID=V8QUL2_9BURK|nr:SDR family oxidoreductase [Advenella kashmirensis]ETF02699.1 oxidoreductase [Advenella kashmirensis W13003]